MEPVGGVCAVQSGVGNAPGSTEPALADVARAFSTPLAGSTGRRSRADPREVWDDSGRCCGAADRRGRGGVGGLRREPARRGRPPSSRLARDGAFGVAYEIVRRGEGPAHPPDPRDRPGLRQTDPAAVVVPRFGFCVQSETARRAPTPWNRSARRPAASAGGRSPSARRVTAVMRTARRRAARSAAAGRCGPPTRAISAVPKAASTIATGSVRTAPAAA